MRGRVLGLHVLVSDKELLEFNKKVEGDLVFWGLGVLKRKRRVNGREVCLKRSVLALDSRDDERRLPATELEERCGRLALGWGQLVLQRSRHRNGKR